MKIAFQNAHTQVTITDTEFVIEGLSGKTLIDALQEAFRSTEQYPNEKVHKLRRVLQEKTGDGRLRDLETWLDYDGKSVFIAALWSDDEASVAVRFRLSVPISAAEFDPQMFIRAAEGTERATSRLAA